MSKHIVWPHNIPNYMQCLLLTSYWLVIFENVWFCTSIAAILVCLLVPSLMMFPQFDGLIFVRWREQGKSSAVVDGANCTPFIIRWHPGTQRGQGKESRGNTSDLRWGGGSLQGWGASSVRLENGGNYQVDLGADGVPCPLGSEAWGVMAKVNPALQRIH